MTGEPSISLATLAERKTYTDGEVASPSSSTPRYADYDTWKPVFDEHECLRRQHGAIEHRI